MSEIVVQGTTPGIRVSGTGAQVTVKVTTGSGGGGGGVTDHNALTGRSDPDQHPIGAVTGLQDALDAKVGDSDQRLSDARTPTAHAASHATGGTDPLTPADIGARPAGNVDWSEIDNKPSIPAAQVNSDWTASSGVAQILHKPTIPSTPGDIEAAPASHSHDITSLTTTAADGKMPVTTSGGITLVDPPSGALAVLADTTLGAAAASVQLVLPQVADADLVLSVKARGTGGTGTLQDLIMTFNSASPAANYQGVNGNRGNAGAVYALNSTIKMVALPTDAPAGWWATNDATVHEYSTAAKHSGVIILGGYPTSGVYEQLVRLTWFMSDVSAAIATVEFSISGMNIAAGSRFTAWARRRS